MVTIVKIRASAFIGGLQWLPAVRDPESGATRELAGDAREFTPHAGHSGRSRIEQEVVVDFERRKLLAFADTGTTRLKRTGPDGISRIEQATAPTDGITVAGESWGAMSVDFVMQARVLNPLLPEEPAVRYELHVNVNGNDGAVDMRGTHDAFPCYEFYKQVDFGDFELLHSHDFRLSGSEPAATDGKMNEHFERKL
ncbi:DUF3238 domain-containing protein [Paenibacillus glycinis]|uniref:DUF3238 domain-containing protein n=1 Tax=Paenibacillus glycinis TaxID=2697035 RepID=A0ABW9XNB7_9BACL|nr:DUF3238 domain-containing protein [Paenibacillus glycinis]NBD24114.1 DUF3238 domain-containing protein [Paenibacillus glycinis]